MVRCDHATLEPRVFRTPTGLPRPRLQCVVCGHEGERIDAASIEADAGLYKRFWSAARKLQQFEQDEIDAAWRARYEAHLRSAHWARLRQLVFEREAGLCQGCRSTNGSEVHHMNYRRMGNELLTDLVLYCDDCHSRFHASHGDQR